MEAITKIGKKEEPILDLTWHMPLEMSLSNCMIGTLISLHGVIINILILDQEPHPAFSFMKNTIDGRGQGLPDGGEID
jgi:hypothetical protein